MTILGIDPGTTHSGVVIWDADVRRVHKAWAAFENETLLEQVRNQTWLVDQYALESVEALYAHVGKETVRTIRYCGRIQEAVEGRYGRITLLSPQEVKKLVCGTASAKDAAVRQALLDQIGPVGMKKNPGPCYGVSSHAWRALAVAVACNLQQQ